MREKKIRHELQQKQGIAFRLKWWRHDRHRCFWPSRWPWWPSSHLLCLRSRALAFPVSPYKPIVGRSSMAWRGVLSSSWSRLKSWTSSSCPTAARPSSASPLPAPNGFSPSVSPSVTRWTSTATIYLEQCLLLLPRYLAAEFDQGTSEVFRLVALLPFE